VQMHGGIGVTYEHDLHFFLRRITLDSLLYGTPAQHRRMIAAMQINQEIAA
jgi:alkylation response protein AidB-like acyl-CoA dehydrogenase